MAQLHGRPEERGVASSLVSLSSQRLVSSCPVMCLLISLVHCPQRVLSVGRPWQTDRRPHGVLGGPVSVFPAAVTLVEFHVCFPMIDSTEKDMTAFLGVGQVV